ncbi:hypothetical protein [Anaerocolumna sp. MB42-C2]|uniref:hypothetical protein n=1 Tax=Anaerocolumna sp. MB42-C2 TaxID=3070997 RepID=UPI0027DF3795|nr:hypothetical protein [Anaerocolumna sp. MB42-C2]WMJ89825.1 hypothetical protein RBU59_09920 [Anaerocolumna sp. MB42-C2]
MKNGLHNNGIKHNLKPYSKKTKPLIAVIVLLLILKYLFNLQMFLPADSTVWGDSSKIPVASAAVNNETGILNDSKLSMKVNYGYNQYVKYGRYMNVAVTLTNNGKEEFEGWLQVIVPKAKNNAAYRREVIVPSQKSTELSIALPVMDDTGLLQVKIIDKNNDTVVENQYDLKIGNYEKLAYVGILSDARDELEYMNQFGTRTFYLNENNLPDDYLGLDLLDVLIINHYDTSRLRDVQMKAIREWVWNGGTLVVGTGEYANEVLSKLNPIYSIESKGSGINKEISFGVDRASLQDLKQDITDYEEERKVFLDMIQDRNDMLTAYGSNPIPIDNSVFERWTKDNIKRLQVETINKHIMNVTMPGSSTMVSEDKIKLMQSSNIGLGKIQLFSFDLGLNNEKQTLGLSILNEIYKNISYTRLTQLDEEYYGSYSNYGVLNSMSFADVKKIPKAGRYIVIIGIYILIIGPVTFILLRKLDKRSLIWAIVPLMALVFTILVYFAGSDTRINTPYIGYVKLLNFEEHNKVNEELYFSLTAPYNHNYNLPIDGNYKVSELRGSDDNSYLYDYKKDKVYFDNYITAINYGTRNTILEVRNNPAFSPVYYQWEDSYESEDKLTYNIHYVGEKVYGTVTNGFNFDLTNAMLTSDGYVINIGEIRKGQTVSLEGKDAIFMTTRDELYNTDIVNRIAGGNGDVKDNTPEVNRLSNILYYLTENNLLNNQHDSCIIGFAKNDSTGADSQHDLLNKLAGKMDAYGATAVKLPVEVDYTAGDKVFVPSIDSYIIASEGYYDIYYQSRYLNNDSMTIKYHLPDNDKVVSFEYLSKRNQDSTSDYISAFDGDIYFLNINTGNFDEVFMTGAGSSVTDIKDYLTDQNTITVRYSTKMSLKGYQMILPYISYWKEADSNVDN